VSVAAVNKKLILFDNDFVTNSSQKGSFGRMATHTFVFLPSRPNILEAVGKTPALYHFFPLRAGRRT